MSELNLFQGANQAFVLEMYHQYLNDPGTVDDATRAFFDNYPVQPPPATGEAAPAGGVTTSAPLDAAMAASRLARFIRQRGHLEANINPLAVSPMHNHELDLVAHNLTNETLALLPASIVGGPQAVGAANALEAIARLRQVYSGSIGYEDEHIQDARERYWLRDAAESRRFFEGIDTTQKRDLLMRLTEVDIFEDFLQKNFQGEKRFSIEGNDSLVPILDEMIRLAAASRFREVVVGMSHRGRLSVLAHVLGKPLEDIMGEFKKNIGMGTPGDSAGHLQGWSGDVKYHLGYKRAFKETGIAEMPITLVPNPSHLEFVGAVVEGHTRAAQEKREHPGEPLQDTGMALPVLIHGDGAFPGQGIVPETLNLSRLPGYRTGGTLHIIINNQIGFTTLPQDARSTLYASDLAKGFEIPIVHVNADDVLACIAVAKMAFAYREQFGKDFLIDLIGYRRYGHNETDEPRTTQPRMYARIDVHPRPREVWARELEKEGLVSRDEASQMVNTVRAKLRNALEHAEVEEHLPLDEKYESGHHSQIETAISAAALQELNEALLNRPEDFAANPDAEKRFYQPRREALHEPGGIFWAHAEALAIASILAEGIPVRMSGQDTERGTFDQRRLVLHDSDHGTRYVPHQHLPQAKASFAIYNSPLSENAVLGFEYGYSMHAPGVLTLWEAQFGDFANGAQVIIDQFIASGRAKWAQTPSLVVLLPHGYEGMGPEHSCARVERFLQLTASDNMRIANCTTAAQYFHLLRRQAKLLESVPRPLVIFTPKSLLRDKNAASSLSDLTEGSFQTVINDADAMKRADQITRLILCTGKVYMNLTKQGNKPRKEYADAKHVAAVRVEQLYPFPEREIMDVIRDYPALQEICWLQEEPQNMGAWFFMEPRLRNIVHMLEWNGTIQYTGRDASASPAEGSLPRHRVQQENIVSMALSDVKEPAVHRRSVLRAVK